MRKLIRERFPEIYYLESAKRTAKDKSAVKLRRQCIAKISKAINLGISILFDQKEIACPFLFQKLPCLYKLLYLRILKSIVKTSDYFPNEEKVR